MSAFNGLFRQFIIIAREVLVENGEIPEIVFQVTRDVIAPKHQIAAWLANAGKIGVLSIAPNSVGNYYTCETGIGFKTRFNGAAYDCFVPFDAMLNIRARGGEGRDLVSLRMMMEDEVMAVCLPLDGPPDDNRSVAWDELAEAVSKRPIHQFHAITAVEESQPQPTDEPAPEVQGRRVGHLTVVK